MNGWTNIYPGSPASKIYVFETSFLQLISGGNYFRHHRRPLIIIRKFSPNHNLNRLSELANRTYSRILKTGSGGLDDFYHVTSVDFYANCIVEPARPRNLRICASPLNLKQTPGLDRPDNAGL